MVPVGVGARGSTGRRWTHGVRTPLATRLDPNHAQTRTGLDGRHARHGADVDEYAAPVHGGGRRLEQRVRELAEEVHALEVRVHDGVVLRLAVLHRWLADVGPNVVDQDAQPSAPEVRPHRLEQRYAGLGVAHVGRLARDVVAPGVLGG